LEKMPALKRGKKRKVPKEQESAIRDGLVEWRDTELLESYYPGTSTISGETLLGDDVIEKLAGCGERIKTHEVLHQHVRWAIGFNESTREPTIHGDKLLVKLQQIYAKLDEDAAAEAAQLAELQAMPETIASSSFYATSSSTQTRTRQRTVPVDNSNEIQDTQGGTSLGRQGMQRERGRGSGRGRGQAQHVQGRQVGRGSRGGQKRVQS